MSSSRGGFHSRLGFVLAAAGSAVGLGNIWGFPTQTASNGGAAFVLVYFVLAFCLAFPAFMAELIIGRHGQANAVTSMQKIARGPSSKIFASFIAFSGILCAAVILSFYGIISGWMMSYAIEPLFVWSGVESSAQWVISHSFLRNTLFTAIFMGLTVFIIGKGVEDGIEKWSKRLMPLLLSLMLLLTLYVMTLDGATEGLEVYLQPDLSQVMHPDLLISALGQAFFSLSIGTSVMIIYGSYIGKKENLVSLGAQVTLIDVSIAFLAGLLIIPAMYVAKHHGVEIFGADGSLISGSGLIFTVLPALFELMGSMGLVVAFIFFMLMTIAALTSSISMLEGAVSYAVEVHGQARKKASAYIGLGIFIFSIVIILNLDFMLDLVAMIATQYLQPLLAMFCCIFVGWLWHRNDILEELKQGNAELEKGLFWKIWPVYIKFICPLAILLVFIHSL